MQFVQIWIQLSPKWLDSKTQNYLRYKINVFYLNYFLIIIFLSFFRPPPTFYDFLVIQKKEKNLRRHDLVIFP